MGAVPIAPEESSAMRTITIEFDSAGWESCSDESLRRLVCKALASFRYRKPIQNTMRIERLRELAKTRGGDCLSTIYLGVKAKLEWVCKEGHTWEATPDTISTGTWCPVCANVRRIIKLRSWRSFDRAALRNVTRAGQGADAGIAKINPLFAGK